VNAEFGGEKRQVLLDEAAKGRATLNNVPLGEIKLSLTSTKDGQQTTSKPVTYTVAESATIPGFLLQVTDDVQTLDEEKSPVEELKNSPTKPAAPERTNSPWTSLMNLLLGVVAVAGIGALVWYFAVKNPAKVKAGLGALGVNTDDVPAASQADDGPLYTGRKDEPMQKIVLDPANPGVINNPVMATPTGVVRLALPSGDVPLTDGTHEIGREAPAGIIVSDASVSRRHAAITRQGDVLTIADLGSTNGTYVNGIRVEADMTLHVGDEVRFGSVAVRVEG
jgi:hypothetical protein